MKKIICLLTLLIGFSANAQSMNPGLWKTVTRYKVNGVPLSPSEDQDCISKSQAADVKTTLSNALAKKGCELTSWRLVGQQLDAELSCNKDGLEATGLVSGLVTPDRYDLVAKAKGTYKHIPSVATIELVGEHVGDCTP
jgi:hypothetical protein